MIFLLLFYIFVFFRSDLGVKVRWLRGGFQKSEWKEAGCETARPPVWELRNMDCISALSSRVASHWPCVAIYI